MDKRKNSIECDLCGVTLPDQKSKFSHVLGKKHQIAQHKKYVLENKQKCGIYVTGLSKFLQQSEIISHFATFGNIVDTFFSTDNRFAIIQFDNEKPVGQLVNSNVVIRGRTLTVKQRIITEKGKGTPKLTQDENFDEINKSLRDCSDLHSQIARLLKLLQPNWTDMVSKYKMLCSDLQNVLQETFPGCIVHPFGSTITGLSFKNSDVDIYVEYPSITKSHDIPSNYAADSVNKSKKLLKRYQKLFSNVISIPKAKTPIIKCIHQPTNLKCDFNFRSMLGVYNSSLIRYYMSLSPKLKPIMIIIKYWAKSHEISRVSGKFSNYALALLVIFYLQHKPYELPSVAHLQSLSNCLNPQEGWNGEFESAHVFSEALNNRSISDILIGFFNFYMNFDFALNVVCPYLGRNLLKTAFLNLAELPNAFESYKVNILQTNPLKVHSSICIQDPFEHNHNVSYAVSAKAFEDFVSLCRFGFEILKDEPNPDLFKLFTNQVEISNKSCIYNHESDFKFKILLGNHLIYLNHEVSNENLDNDSDIKETKIKKAWFKLVQEFTESFLTNILRFKVTSDDDCLDIKSQRLDDQIDVHDTVLDNLISFNCIGFTDFWSARKSISKDFKSEKTLSLIENQSNLTNYISDLLYKNMTFNDAVIDIKVSLQANPKPTEVIFHVINNASVSKKSYFKTFSVFFIKYTPILFEKYISELDNRVLLQTTETIKDDEPDNQLIE